MHGMDRLDKTLNHDVDRPFDAEKQQISAPVIC
jgi:hypothetical protein